jgi:prepilin-type N-terminal cleavage/methylation domain-containing protein
MVANQNANKDTKIEIRARKQPNGFSLIELPIAVAIILIVAAISIPSLIRSKIAAKEASAVGSLKNGERRVFHLSVDNGEPGFLSRCRIWVPRRRQLPRRLIRSLVQLLVQ